MRFRLACLLVFALGVGAAYGQQSPPAPAHAGGTCSGHAAACENLCKDRPIRAGGCSRAATGKRRAGLGAPGQAVDRGVAVPEYVG